MHDFALTKMIATLGPASNDAETLDRLIAAGVAVFRLNFSHGDHDAHASNVEAVRAAAARAGRPVGILGDLQGPKIRVGRLPDGGIEVAAGEMVVFARHEPGPGANGDGHRIWSTWSELIDEVEPGHRVLIDDGAIRMLAIDRDSDTLTCNVTVGGTLLASKGINLPDTVVSLPALAERDFGWVRWAVEHELDFLALSFVSSPDDVRSLAECIRKEAAAVGRPSMTLPIVAKIERPRAVEQIEAITDEADAIMVARGDLGVEMDLATVPVAQKKLLAVASQYGKPCIVATQMLQSMVDAPSPTRAEASDVAGAIFDGADATMLSGETAVGKYPVLTVETMRYIARHTESYIAESPRRESAPAKLVERRYGTAALAHGVWTIVGDIGARFIFVWSQRGGGARYLSQNNFAIPILAASSDERSLRRMQLLRGVVPVPLPLPPDLATFTHLVDDFVLREGWADEGDACVLVAGNPIGTPGVTNSLAIHHVGDGEGGFR